MDFVHIDGTSVVDEILGVGGSGLIVRHGQFADKIPRLSLKIDMPGGRLTPEEGDFDMRQFRIEQMRREKAIYRRLGSHPGIVPCFELETPEPLIRMACMKNGNLREYLARGRPDKKTQLSWLTDMAHTLVHIHACRIIVADIRLENLLLDENLSVKFADFGESSLMPLDWDMKEPDEDGESVSTDIGKFGTVMYEILTGQRCKFDLMQKWKKPGDPLTWPERESLPSTDNIWLGHIIEACWTKSFTSAHELAVTLDTQNVGSRDNNLAFELTCPMAEPISLASGLVALVTFAFQSSIALYNTVRSFQSHPKRVRDLIEELEALSGVLGLLTETVSSNPDGKLSILDLPLLRCGNSCEEFEQELMEYSSQSGGSWMNFRDWAKLRYMGEDIDWFRRLLAGYKLTFNIALTDANMRKSPVKAETLESYNDLVKTTITDLEAHLQSIDEKLETMFKQTITESNSDVAERQLIREEQLGSQRCLQICAQFSEHISQIQLTSNTSGKPVGLADLDAPPEKITNVGLQECKNSLIVTAGKLERHLQDLMDRLIIQSEIALTSEEDVAGLVRLREEWETTRQCMEICSKANHSLKEYVSNIDNYATNDAIQFMVLTNGKVIHGENRGLSWRTRQVGGLLSDASALQISRHMTSVSTGNTGNKGAPSRGDTQSVLNDKVENGPTPDIQVRYGHGFQVH